MSVREGAVPAWVGPVIGGTTGTLLAIAGAAIMPPAPIAHPAPLAVMRARLADDAKAAATTRTPAAHCLVCCDGPRKPDEPCVRCCVVRDGIAVDVARACPREAGGK